jgi:hypothetical protein
MATAAPALKALNKLAQSLPLGEGEGSQGGPLLDTKTDEQVVASPPPANLPTPTPVETPPQSMAPGLGTTGGAPADADSPAKPADWKPTDDPSVVSLKSSAKSEQKGWKPTDDSSVVPLKPATTQPQETWKPTDDSSVVPLPAKPQWPEQAQPQQQQPTGQATGAPTGTAEQPKEAEQPATAQPRNAQDLIAKLIASGMSQDAALAVLRTQHPELTFANPATGSAEPLQTQPPQIPPRQQPTGQVSGAPTGTSDQPWGPPLSRDDQIAALVDQGHSSGAAQAVVDGKIPKSLSGNVPAPPETTAPPAEQTPPPAQQPAPAQQPKGETVDWKDLGYPSFAAYKQFSDSIPGPKVPVTQGPGTTAILGGDQPSTSTTPAAPSKPVLNKKGQVAGFSDLSDSDKTLYTSGVNKAQAGQVPNDAEMRALYKANYKIGGEAAGSDSGETPAEKPQNVRGGNVTGTSTIFGLNYDGSIDAQDNGRGIFGANTRNPNLKGVAVPVDILEATFGHAFQKNAQGGYDMLDTPEARKVIQAIRSAHVEALGADGKIHSYPIVDIQGSIKGHPGHALDLTYGAAKDMGFRDNHSVSYQIVGGDGKPYGIDPDKLAAWNTSGGDSSSRSGNTSGSTPGIGTIGFMPIIPTHGPSGSALPSGGSPQLPGPSGGGGGGTSQPDTESLRLGANLSDMVGAAAAGAALANAARGGGQQRSAPPSDEEPENPMVAALMNRGFSPQQAQQFAQSSQTVTPGKGTPPINVKGPPPAAPSASAQLPVGAQASFKLMPAKALMPHKVPKIGAQGKGPPPAAPSAAPTPRPGSGGQAPPAPSAPAARTPTAAAPQSGSGQAQPAVDPSVVLGLMKRGFTREQALAFAGRATVSQPGASAIAGAKSFRTPASSASSSVPSSVLQSESPPAAPAAPSRPAREPVASAEPEPFEGRPAGSTHGDPNPKGLDDAIAGLKLPQAAKVHASLLSPDDPRVKRQADGAIKGEHFVDGDPLHDQLLEGLPGGKGGRQRALLAQAEQAIQDKEPMHISYLSAPKEAEKFPTRDSRRIQYDESSPEARLMGTTEGQLVGHSFIPVSVGVTPSRKADEPHQGVIHGISTHVLANNVQHLNDKLAEMGQKTPYKELGAKFTNDLEGYLSNLNAGHVGTGQGYAVGTADHPNEPDLSHVPFRLTRREADFINASINNTAAFSKHEDAETLRELARANGTLITPEGETNRIRHEIEQHEPGWRQRVLEPTIRSFKTGLIREIHPSEEHLPETIRPGREYRDITKAIARTTYRGRPDVPIATSPRSQPSASIPRDLAHNAKINEIERHFSEDKITEARARKLLEEIGENPDEYQFHGGSGGLLSPYEPSPTALTPEQHAQLKDSLLKKWLSGGLDIETYKRRVAEVPLPELPSRPASTKVVPEEKKETPSPESVSTPQKKSKAPAPGELAATPPDVARTAHQKLGQAHGEDADSFLKILGVTQNFGQARDALNQLKAGNFDSHLNTYAEGQKHLDRGADALKKHVLKKGGVYDQMVKGGTMPTDDNGKPKKLDSDAASMAAFLTQNRAIPQQRNGRAYSGNAHHLLRVMHEIRQAAQSPEEENEEEAA